MVHIEQLYTGCLSEAAYFVVSDGEAVVIDPLRETTPYLSRAAEQQVKIKYVLETHFHADFVSGHVDLASAADATIVFGPTATPEFDALVLKDEQVLSFGRATLTALHTPGHTMESTCFLLRDENSKPVAIFTGDTLFIGDVGRPDLAQRATSMTKEQLAAMLYHSLRTKIMPLPDDIVVYPAHGAGSACGKAMSKETFDTLGHQKVANYALRSDLSEADFVAQLCDGIAPPPKYFPAVVERNKGINASFETVLQRGRTPLSVADVERLGTAKESASLVVEVRRPTGYSKAHIPFSVFAGLDDGAFGPLFATAVADLTRPVIIVSPPERLDEAITRLARFGFDNILGHLEGGFQAWLDAGKPTRCITDVTPEQLAEILEVNPNIFLVDVRKPAEHTSARHKLATNIPLDHHNFVKVAGKPEIYAHCLGGFRSLIFLSVLLSEHRFDGTVYNILGGFEEMEKCEKLWKWLEYSECSGRTGPPGSEKKVPAVQ